MSRSSTKAECRGMATTLAELMWLSGFLKKLGVEHKELVILYCDSKVTIQIPTNLVFNEQTKHIEINCHFIR